MKRFLFIFLGALLCLTAGCRPGPVEPALGVGPLVLRPVIDSDAGDAAMSFFHERYPGVEVIEVDDLSSLLEPGRTNRPPLVVPAPSLFPVDAFDLLADYARDGGGVLLWGTRPFEDRVVRLNGRPYTKDTLTERLMKEGQVLPGMLDVELWRHENDSDRIEGSVKRVKEKLPWPAVRVTMGVLNVWDALLVKDVPGGISDEWDMLLFYASGDERSTRLVVLVEEEDRSVWMGDVPLHVGWSAHALHERAFRHVSGGLGRGGRDDRLDLGKMRRITVGLDMRYAPQHPGRHEFGMSEIRFAADPRATEFRPVHERFPAAHPGLRFGSSAQAFEHLSSGRVQTCDPIDFESPLPGPRGMGGAEPEAYRWIPLVRALSDDEAVPAWPASLFLVREDTDDLGRWGWVGLDLARENLKLAKPMVLNALERLRQPVAMAHVEGPPTTVRPDTILEATARCRMYDRVDSDGRVIAELFKEDGLLIRRKLSPKLFETSGTNRWHRVTIPMGVMPYRPDEENRYRIRVAVESATHETVWDEVDQPVAILPAARTPPPRDPLAIRGSQLVIHNLSQFLLGVEYSPLFAGTSDRDGAPRHWLDHGIFDARAVRRDLAGLFELGVNTLVVQVRDESQAPQLNYFLEEAARHRFWIVLQAKGLNPLKPKLEEARRLLEAIDLANRPEVIALEVMRDVELGPYRLRMALDYEWARWLQEQYGTPEQFERVVGMPVWSILNNPTGPTDFELVNEGEHAAAVTVYRRFVRDFTSRRLGRVKRFLREAGFETYLAARGGYSGNALTVRPEHFPLDLAGAAVHADILMPSGRGLYGALDRFYESAFLTAYARGVSNGKPVVWAGMGVPAPAEITGSYLENQDRIFLNSFLLATLSYSSGLLVSSYAEPRPVEAGSYAGIVGSDGSFRPAGLAFREFGHRLRKTRPVPREWKGRETELPTQARGFLTFWDAWRNVYHKELRDGAMEEVRPFGFSFTTKNMPLVSLGGREFVDPAPLACVNAEWGVVEFDGKVQTRTNNKPIRIKVRKPATFELINTGVSSWDASRPSMDRTVWVNATLGDRNPTMLKLPGLKFGESARVGWSPPDAGTWRLRAFVKGVGAFGEALVVEVE